MLIAATPRQMQIPDINTGPSMDVVLAI